MQGKHGRMHSLNINIGGNGHDKGVNAYAYNIRECESICREEWTFPEAKMKWEVSAQNLISSVSHLLFCQHKSI